MGATFSGTADISSAEEGLVALDVRAFDVAGNVAYARTAAYKDVTPPSVEIVVPNDDAIVNGDNLICFNVSDNASFEKAYYIAPPTGKSSGVKTEITDISATFVSTHIGTSEKPIDDGMSFEFVDAAGNVSSYESWKFLIDSKSDLPVAEIHLPTYEDVITRDFTISGVVYDDDGPSSIYYRIDGGPYNKLEEMGTSFAIDVPFSTMTDNEHTINVYAVDINGVKGPVAERKFRVSTEEPKGAVETPTIDKANKGLITLAGVASDRNDIESSCFP
ncbi:MAG: Ig-like domain-containing protein [Treponema sp.]|nr:MAG: Ig-like domain-containing protein [Treponema sp.]